MTDRAARIAAAREVMDRLVVDVPEWPEPGVVFKDITPMLSDGAGLATVITALADAGRADDGASTVDVVVGMESRGFILGAPVALQLGVGFVPVRKHGKLPRATHQVDFTLEYGQATLEIHRDAVRPGQRVLLVDDVLATGGTMGATLDLVRRCGGVPAGIAVLIELSFLPGRAACDDVPVTSLTTV